MAKNAGDSRPDDVSPDDAKKMADIAKAMGECSMKAMTPDSSGSADFGLGSDTTPPPPPPDPSAGGGGDLEPTPAGMEACNEYRAILEKMIACAKYPPSGKDALKKGWSQMVQSAKTGGASTVKVMADTCTRMMPDLKKAIGQICP
jgi:hypothetical protein